MGFASSGACFPTKPEALANWCAKVEPGDNAASCESCDSATSTCSITFLQSSSGTAAKSSSGTAATVSVPVNTPSCVVPTPVNDALMYTSAIVLLWVVMWSAKEVIKLFRVPHADSN